MDSPSCMYLECWINCHDGMNKHQCKRKIPTEATNILHKELTSRRDYLKQVDGKLVTKQAELSNINKDRTKQIKIIEDLEEAIKKLT